MVPVPLIEEELKKNPKGLLKDQRQILGLAKQLDWSERQVERWIRRRKQQNRHSGFFFKLKNEFYLYKIKFIS